MPDLKLKSKGADVKRVQEALNGHMFSPNKQFQTLHMRPLAEDGDFGPKTDHWVREFQRLSKIKNDGIVGPITSRFLFPYVSFAAVIANGRSSASLLSGALHKVPISLIENPTTSVLDMILRAVPLNSLEGDKKVPQVADAENPLKPSPPAPEGEKQGFTFEPSVSPGMKLTLKPWAGEPFEASRVLAVEGTFLRWKDFELGAGFEFGQPLFAVDKATSWQGALKATYAWKKKGPLTLASTAELQLKEGWKAGGSLGLLQAELSFDITKKGWMKFVVGGKALIDIDDKGTLEPGIEGALGLKFALP